jgi:putative sterol carrier protein
VLLLIRRDDLKSKEFHMPTIESLMSMLPGMFEAEKAIGSDAIIQLNITGLQTSHWTIEIKNGKLSVAKGIHPTPKLTLTADSNDILDLANGKLEPGKAFTQGKLHVKGDVTEAARLIQLFRVREHA